MPRPEARAPVAAQEELILGIVDSIPGGTVSKEANDAGLSPIPAAAASPPKSAGACGAAPLLEADARDRLGAGEASVVYEDLNELD